MIKEKYMPCNLEIEGELIGQMINFAIARNDALSVLNRSDFFLEEHQIVFDTIYKLNNENKDITVFTIWHEIKMQKKNEMVNFDFLRNLSDDAVSGRNYNDNIDVIRENANLRDLLRAINDIEKDFLDNERTINEYSAFVAQAQKKINLIADQRKISNFLSSHEIVQNVSKYIENMINKQTDNNLIGFNTGFRALNYYTNGFQKQNLIIIAGRPGLGKTALALNLLLNIAMKENKTVAMFEMEMPSVTLYLRLTSVLSNVRYDKISKGKLNNDEKMMVEYALSTLDKLKIYIDDSVSLTIIDLIAKARKLKSQCPDLAVIFIDYLGLISLDVRSNKKYGSRQLEIQEYSRLLHELSRELDISIVLLCQLNRKVEDRGGIPRLSDLRESGSIEQDAELVLLLHREDYGKNELLQEKENNQQQNNLQNNKDDRVSIMDVIIAKNRNGESDRRFQLFFRKSFGSMLDVPYGFEDKKKQIEKEFLNN